ncbi:MAG: beta-aspartyl-peptidase [Clostridium butyricum]|nr:beta-aspartyl-peptidase [Clostridium butyricum]
MMTIIKGCEIYSPKYIGKKDILICGSKIEGIYDELNINNMQLDIELIDGKEKLLFPGFIDSHVHILGGGGEGGYETRTPELGLSTITEAGITTLVGCRGTDDVCRSSESLLAKAKSLKNLGISVYCYTGSYEIPVKTLTGSIKGDLLLIEEFIGVGEIAISDNRSSQATYEEFTRTVAESRVGGILSGKCGIVNIHLGDGVRRLKYLFDLIEGTEIPVSQLLPTHINRNSELLKEGIRYTKEGGFIDLTTSCDPDNLGESEFRAGKGLKFLIDNNVPIENITFSSDGNGSLPNFDKVGNLINYGICSVKSLYGEVCSAIEDFNIPIEVALQAITSNVAERLCLKNKGSIQNGKDADLVIVDKNSLEIEIVIARGKKMVENRKAIVKGYFE